MIEIDYVTASKFKKDECRAFVEVAKLSDGRRVKDVFTFNFRDHSLKEILAVELEDLVENEAERAYANFRVPCIVEHAGLIFDDYKAQSYPGGLTKAMWNALGEKFVEETHSANRRAIARAVVGYCDGMKVKTYVGETAGTIAEEPSGDRKFYWDTVFIPDTDIAEAKGRTYSQIVADPKLGLAFKMEKLSQSGKAMLKFLEDRLGDKGNLLWKNRRAANF